jgi:hypothetical protein
VKRALLIGALSALLKLLALTWPLLLIWGLSRDPVDIICGPPPLYIPGGRDSVPQWRPPSVRLR